MALLHSDVLCPYCLQELRSKDVKMACPLCGTETTASKTDILLKRLPRCAQPSCHNNIANDKLCGYCGAKLPSDIMDYSKYLRFSILGTTGAGKTTFLTTMLHELRHTRGTPLPIAPMNAETTALFQVNDNAIYHNRQNVEANPPGTPPQPQQWSIKDLMKMTATRIPSYSLTVFDGAGEDCEHIDPVISRYISGSKVLVILIDPLALSSVSCAIPRNILQWSAKAEHDADASAALVDGLANYVRQSCGIRPNKLIDRDVAVVFTKIDAVKDSFGHSTVMQPSPHLKAKGFVQADGDAVNAEIRDWLERQGETAFLNAIETNFKMDKTRFFGVSSFGQPPVGDNTLGIVTPHRVLDPLMWMFSREGIIPTL